MASATNSPKRTTRMTEREKMQGRLEVAKLNGGASAAMPRGNDRYTVIGRAGDRYTVAVFGDTFLCDCKAGIHGGNCWHQAATFLRIIADRSVAA